MERTEAYELVKAALEHYRETTRTDTWLENGHMNYETVPDGAIAEQALAILSTLQPVAESEMADVVGRIAAVLCTAYGHCASETVEAILFTLPPQRDDRRLEEEIRSMNTFGFPRHSEAFLKRDDVLAILGKHSLLQQRR